MRVLQRSTLTEALDLGPGELVAMVGGGGKTGALQLLAEELSGQGAQVLVTTTTAMLLKDLERVGPVLFETGWPALRARLDAALVEDRLVCVVRELRENGKAAGLPVEWVDELWATGWADYILAEADGSRGMSLKAFADEEPQVPSTTTVLVQVAGLDVLGAPLAELHVHRAELLSSVLGVPLGAPVAREVFVGALRAQLRSLRGRWPAARIVTLLNKAEDSDVRQVGIELGNELLATFPHGEDHRAYEAVIVGSVREREFLRNTASRDD